MRALGLLAISSLCACEIHGIVGANLDGAGDGGGGGDHGVLGDEQSPSSTTGGEDGVGGGTGGGDGDTTAADPFLFDVSPGDGAEVCLAPYPTSCDHVDEDPWHALGVTCAGGARVDTSILAHSDAVYVHTGPLGTSGAYTPREGQRMVIVSTGKARDVPRSRTELGCFDETCPSSALAAGSAMSSLPAPMDVRAVDPSLTCTDDPELVGTGDCSNTLADEWTTGQVVYDYAELRLSAKVPEHADALVYEFAFFSAEYPSRVDQAQGPSSNDMFVAWLESEAWTGNVSFDGQGNPISINGVFLDYLDADSDRCTEHPCVAPELDGFAMDGHAGTRWLETVAPVVPGEEIEIIFAIFDIGDPELDSAVVLDGVHWGCTDLPPVTAPTG